MKTCTKCGILQPLDNYHKDKTAPDGHVAQCRACRKEITKEYNSRPEVKIRISERGKRLYADPNWLATKRRYDRKYYAIPENQEKAKANAARREKDPEGRKKINAQRKQRKREDLQFKLGVNLRGRLGAAVKNNSKTGSAVQDLGCSIEELKTHLESKFQPGMEWGNWGKGKNKWNIDHIMPLAAFDLTNRQHVVLACNYLNLQPLWFQDNLEKHNKILQLEYR